MNLNRRGILKVFASAPVLVPEVGLPTLGVAGVQFPTPPVTSQPAIGKEPRFTDFTSWLTYRGRESLEEQASNVKSFDPDIWSFRLPLATKYRFQRERNYARLLESKERWFKRCLGERGFVSWWD